MNRKILLGLAAIGGVVVVGVVGVLVAASLQNGDYRIERSAEIAAPASVVYPYLSDFHHFPEWSPWEKLDPNMNRTFSGAAQGVGAVYSWNGNDQVGEGRMTIVAAAPNEKVDVKLEFFKPWASTSRTIWSLKPQAEGARVTWVMEGTNEGVVAKTFAMFMDVDKMVGKDFETGLAQLKQVAEKAPKAP